MNYEKKLKQAINSKNIFLIEKTFEEIYYEYANLVGFVISKYVENKEDIEEMINDVFLYFFNRINKIEFSNIKYYLVTQAKNKAIDYLKAKKKKINVTYDDFLLDNKKDKGNDYFYEEIINEMKKHLKEFEIEVIILHSVYLYTFNDIAKEFNKNSSSINSIYQRAIKKLRKR